MSTQDYEAIVIGGGFAGVTAARDLHDKGHSVLLLEARDRLGGRTWYKPFAAQGRKLEFGGTWVAPQWQRHIGAEIDRYAAKLVESPQPGMCAWSLAGERYGGAMPLPVDQWMEFERAIRLIDNTAARIRFGEAPLDQNGLGDLDVPFTSWLESLDLPAKTSEFLLAWAGFYFGAHPSEVSALHILSWVAGFGNSAIGWYVGVSTKLARGTIGLLTAMAEDSAADVHLETPVRSIESTNSGVIVTTHGGESYHARTAVLATPINTWHDIDITPLAQPKAAIAAERHAGHSVKIWALVRGLPGNFYGVGYDTKIKWLATEYNTPEGDLLVGFGTSPEELDVTNGAAVAAAVREFLPDADVVATDAHDWNADPYSQGTWMAYRPGQVMRHASGIQRPEGAITFAGSDLASGWCGWIDGAIESGHRAAEAAAGMLVAGRIARPV
jgi:monoamine oxidase